MIYADFEALTTKLEGPDINPQKSNTQKSQQHEACGYGYIGVWSDGFTEAPVVYRGPNAAESFLEAMQEEERRFKEILKNPKDTVMTLEDWSNHR